ncbi:MAG: calcium-transporting P-type ATPase, PMR1-type [Candidatus Jordarchaeum sp.]|uniref:calcium-transporting P-type ATPase, PMR1-type n=1 Tax=Candidatus Jordarchaeum sp. TaxID=2823881 RepID=UPI00404B169A
MNVESVEAALKTGLSGVKKEEAKRRLEEFGPNILQERKGPSALRIFAEQFKNYLIMILIAASIIAIFLGDLTDAFVISVVVILNALLGFYQEYRAEKSIEALKKLTAPRAIVIREGHEEEIPASELIPGDLVIIETGDRVPADIRISESTKLEIDESILTGESIPVKKRVERLEVKNLPVSDRSNMAYMSTIVTRGRGNGYVVSTGMKTEIGRIAELIQTVEHEETPLQIKLKDLAKKLTYAVILICVIVFLTGILRQENIFDMFLAAVGLAVAAIPESLPAVVTITLALGVQRMAKRNAVIRKLPAVQTLGSATIICSDKTGTFTKNEMTVTKLYTNNNVYDVTNIGYNPKGEFYHEDSKVNPREIPSLELLLTIGTLCNNAKLEKNETWHIIGDPTEGALIVAAEKAGLKQEELGKQFPRVGEIPFESERKIMSTIHKTPEGKKIAYVKGAAEIILNLSSKKYSDGQIRELTTKEKTELLKINQNMASDALRVLAMAYRELPEEYQEYTTENVEKDLIFVGFEGMLDPPREEAIMAVQTSKKAGIKVVMITGDNEFTARSIARKLGLLEGDSKVLTGADLENMSEAQLDEVVQEVAVYARVSPEHKLRIVKSLQKKDHIVAMSGDGVNDAPALRKADIGVAMGITGTDVAKEASDMILVDDNFASSVAAVEEGRTIYNNIKKTVYFLLSTNAGEILTIFIGLIIGLPIPVIAVQILWINLVTDSFPALALSVDPPEKGVMFRHPRDPGEPVITKRMLYNMVGVGTLMCVSTLLLYSFTLGVFSSFGINYAELELARTIAFTNLVFLQLFNAFNTRSRRESIFKIGLFSNKYLVLGTIISVVLQLAVVYLPPLQILFRTVSLSPLELGVVILVSSSILVGAEIMKFFDRRLIRNKK